MEPEARRFHWNPSLWKGKQQYGRNKFRTVSLLMERNRECKQHTHWLWSVLWYVHSGFDFHHLFRGILYCSPLNCTGLFLCDFFTKYVLQYLCRVSWISKYKGTMYKEGQVSYMWIFESVEGQWPIMVSCVIYEHVVCRGERKQASHNVSCVKDILKVCKWNLNCYLNVST